MRDSFPGWVPPDQNTLDRYWREATFAVDTSVLLDLYRFSADARKGLLDALKSFGDRLWIPHQVVFEFHRNRYGVLLDQREAEENLLRELDGIRKDLDAQLSQRLRGAGRRDLDPLRDAINDGFRQLRESLQKAEKAHTEGLGKSIQEDPIYEEVESLCAGRIGDSFSEEELAVVIDDAKRRISAEEPPGYLDAGKTGDAQYGDVILWHQLCARAMISKGPIVLVADDRKADWVWEVRGKTLGPRPELVAEMMANAGVGFHLYTPSRLFELWKDRQDGEDERSGILEEIRSPSFTEPREPLFRERARRRLGAGQSAVDAFNRGVRAAQQPYRLVVSASSAVDFVDGAWVLSLEFIPYEIDGVTPGISAQVTDDRGQSSTAAFPMGIGTAGQSQIVTLKYPQNFVGGDQLVPGTYTVEWTAFGHGTSSSPSTGETREILARNSFAVLGHGDAPGGAL